MEKFDYFLCGLLVVLLGTLFLPNNYDLGLGISQVMVVCTLISPVLAIRVDRFISYQNQKINVQQQIFKTLMRTRSSRLSFDHVYALNMIEIEFSGKEETEKQVIDIWRQYHDTFKAEEVTESLKQKQEGLFIDLLYAMSLHLEYNFDKTTIRNSWYTPRIWGDITVREEKIRENLNDLTSKLTSCFYEDGEGHSFKIDMYDSTPPNDDKDKPEQESKVVNS